MFALVRRHWRPLTATSIFVTAVLLGNAYLRRGGNDLAAPDAPIRSFVSTAVPATHIECETLANEWTKAALSTDSEALKMLIDFDEIAAQAGNGIAMNDRGLKESMKGFRSSLLSQFEDVPRLIGKRGSYRLVGIRERNDARWALIRLVSDDSTINYHDLLIQRQPGGPPKVTDIDIAASGEPVTVTLNRYLRPIAPGTRRRTKAEQEHVDSIGRMTEIVQLQTEGQHAKVLEKYRKLPESRQREKIALIARLRSATLVSATEHEAALTDLRKFHPGDRCLALASMEYHLQYGDHQQLLDAVNDLDRVIGGDPYLDVIRISALFGLNRTDEALSTLAATQSWDDSYYQVQYLLLLTSIVRGEFDKAEEHSRYLEKNFGFQLSDFEGHPDFAQFLARESYQAWKKSREDH